MSSEPDWQQGENLRRWQESGGPRRWVDARRGQWNHDDWLGLLEDLRRSPFWPLDADAVGLALEEARRRRQNLRRWELSGQARRWVEERQARWEHGDWLALLENLAASHFGPHYPDRVGAVLEEIRQEWHNLRRWQDSGAARRWAEVYPGRGAGDTEALREALQRSEFWPLDLAAAGEVLERLRSEACNLRRWEQSGQAALWVEARRGDWNHGDWLALLESLRRSPFWPLDADALGQVLERAKRKYWNLRRWVDSGAPRRWVAERGGRWSRAECLALLESLRQSEFWPLDADEAEETLERVAAESRNLRRWLDSGRARRWVEEHRGEYDRADWEALLGSLRGSPYWPLDPTAVEEALRDLIREWWNLRRWRTSGLARRWVEAHQGRWGHADVLALLAALERSEFGPVDPDALARVLEEVGEEWRNLRRWQDTGEPERLRAAGRLGWREPEWLALLDNLKGSAFWPLDPRAARQVVEGLPAPARQAA